MDVKTAAAAAAGVSIGAGLCYVLLQYLHSRRADTPALAIPVKPPSERATAVRIQQVLEDDILREHFTRNIQFFGEQAQQRLTNSLVVVIGLGGVGSHAAHMLLRSGVGRLRIVDFDQVTLSTLNRHAVATRDDVGKPKATCLQQHFKNIVPEAQVESLVAMYTQDSSDTILQGNPDYVVDAIDNIHTKVALLVACQSKGIPVICATGAGAKADPTRIRLAPMSKALSDPLARAVRRRLQSYHGIQSGITMVVSTEQPRCKLLPPDEFTEGQGDLSDYQVIPNFRVRTIPVLGTTPAMFGMAAAAHVICALADFELITEPVFTMKETLWQGQIELLGERLERQAVDVDSTLQVDEQEVCFLIRDVWHGMSARELHQGGTPQHRGKAARRHLPGHVLTRWDAALPATLDNLVFLTTDEADEHDRAESLEEVHVREPAYAAYVERRLQAGLKAFELQCY